MSLQTKFKTQSGFTIIEVLLTLFMIGVSLLLFQATANAVALNKFNRYKEIALRVADKKIETVRTTPFASIPATGSFSDSQLSLIPNGQATMTVTTISSTLKDVTVLVTWTRPKGTGTQQVQLETYVYSGGLGQ